MLLTQTMQIQAICHIIEEPPGDLQLVLPSTPGINAISYLHKASLNSTHFRQKENSFINEGNFTRLVSLNA